MANMTFKASLLPSSDFGYSLGSNDVNNLKRWKINGFSGGPIEYIVGEQTAATGLWTGTTQDNELVTGKVIAYKLPFAGSGSASLTLTFTNPIGDSNSGAIPVYLNNTRVTTHYAAGSVIIMVYDGTNWRSTDYWNSNSRDAGYGKINLTQSDATTAIATNTTQLAAHTYNEAITLTAGNKWVQFQGTNSDSNNADILTVGHSLSGVTAGDYGDGFDQTPSYGDTFNVPTLSVDAAGHITAISTHSVKIPASDDTDVKQRIYGSATNIELPIPGINGSASTTATVPSIGTSYKDTYAAIPTTNIATINPSTGKITIPGGLKVGVGNSTRMPTTGIEVQDTRTEDFTPGTISKGVNFFFTNKTNPVGNSWCSGIYVRGWSSNATVSYGAWCLTGPAGEGDVSTKPLYVRTSKNDTEWGAYRKIYDTSNKPTPSEILGESDTTKFWRGDQSWSNEISGGIFKITNNENTISIGSQDESYSHFMNSADIPFYFNKAIHLNGDLIPYGNSNSKNLGSSSRRWQKLYIGTADSYGSTTQPIYWNAGVPTAITYTANRLYYPSAVNAFTAGTHFVSDTKIAINSTNIPDETLYVNGNTKINGTLHITPPSGSYVEGIRIYPSSAGWTSIALCGTDNTGNSGTSAATWSLHTKDSNFYLSQNGSSSATVRFTGHNGNGFSIRPRLSINADVNTEYNLYVNGTSYLNGSLYMPATSGIYTIGNKATYMMIRFMDNTADTYGNGISIGGGGPTIIGGGESANTMADHNGNNGNEIMYIGNDGNIDFYTNLQDGWDSGKHIYMDTNGDFRGSRYIYANYYNASCGAETPTNASYWVYSNSDGFFRKSTLGNLFNLIRDNGGDSRWVKKSGDTMTGSLTLPSIELMFTTPFIDFHYNNSTADYTNRIIEDASGELKITGKLKVGTTRNNYVLNAASFICDSWVRTVGSTGWYNETYGGGWYMIDNTYIRNYGSKQVYLNAQLGVDATLRMWSASRQITRDASGRSWVDGRNGAILRMTGTASTNYNPITSCKSNNGSWEMGTYTANNGLYFTYITDANFNAGTNSVSAQVEFRGSDNSVRASKVYGAVWNDYAEYRKDNIEEKNIQEPGRCVKENGDGTLSLTTKRLERGCEIISDTFGFAIGQDEDNGYNTPIASSGRVLAYPYEPIEEFVSHIGYAVCSGPNGTVSIMTDEEEEKYPMRAIGTISEIPDYEEWGTGKVKVNGRVWIRIR